MQPIAGFVNEDAPMRNREPVGGLVRLLNDDDTTGFRRERSARDAVRFLCFMNESRPFVCLCVCLSAEKNGESIPTVTLNHRRLY